MPRRSLCVVGIYCHFMFMKARRPSIVCSSSRFMPSRACKASRGVIVRFSSWMRSAPRFEGVSRVLVIVGSPRWSFWLSFFALSIVSENSWRAFSHQARQVFFFEQLRQTSARSPSVFSGTGLIGFGAPSSFGRAGFVGLPDSICSSRFPLGCIPT